MSCLFTHENMFPETIPFLYLFCQMDIDIVLRMCSSALHILTYLFLVTALGVDTITISILRMINLQCKQLTQSFTARTWRDQNLITSNLSQESILSMVFYFSTVNKILAQQQIGWLWVSLGPNGMPLCRDCIKAIWMKSMNKWHSFLQVNYAKVD